MSLSNSCANDEVSSFIHVLVIISLIFFFSDLGHNAYSVILTHTACSHNLWVTISTEGTLFLFFLIPKIIV